jgi:hypothetical protein
MPDIVAKVAAVFTPAVRQWLYNVSLVCVPLLVVYGIVDDKTAALWVALGGAILGQGTAAVTLKTQRVQAAVAYRENLGATT